MVRERHNCESQKALMTQHYAKTIQNNEEEI